jgi:hypothetical protein
MQLTIRNLTDGVVLLRFSNGANHYLGPRERLPGIARVDVRSRQIERLEQRRIVAIERPGEGRRRSGDMTAKEAVEHIQRTAPTELEGFLSDGERRTSVLNAMAEKRQS